MTRRLFTLHAWLGLLTGLLLLVVSGSGVVLLYEPELDRAFNPALLRVPVGAKDPALNAIYRAARARYPVPAVLRFRRVPAETTASIEVSVEHPDNRWTLAYFDPVTARYLGERNAREHFLGWLLGVHYGLWGGKSGELVVALLGLALALSVLTGAVIYRRHLVSVLLFRARVSWANWRTAASGLHRVVGVWSLLLNLVFAVSGAWMLRGSFDPATYTAEPEALPVTQPAPTTSLDELPARAARALPGFQLRGLRLPATPADTVLEAYGELTGQPLYGDFTHTVTFSARTGQVVAVANRTQASGTERLETILETLHFGQFGGLLIKLIWTVGGLSPAILSLTGFLLWWRHRRRPKPRHQASNPNRRALRPQRVRPQPIR